MTWQSIARMSFVGSAVWLLGGCVTPNFEDAEPEKYAGFDCQQLDMLSESYRANSQDLLLEEDPSELERTNSRQNYTTLANRRADDAPDSARDDRDRRSIALARRQKGCL